MDIYSIKYRKVRDNEMPFIVFYVAKLQKQYPITVTETAKFHSLNGFVISKHNVRGFNG